MPKADSLSDFVGVIKNINLPEEFILTEKYSIITETKNKNEFISPYFVKSSEVSDKEIGCEVFDITGA